MFKKYNKKPSIKFYTNIPGLADIPELQPQPAHNFIPQWWKSLPKQKPYPEIQTVKVCPALPDFFSQGYIIPLWSDMILRYSKEKNEFLWYAGRPDSTNPIFISSHSNEQFVDFVSPSFQGREGYFVFKFNSPWFITTSKGYSVFQLPLFYHFNEKFSVLPGIIHTDTHNQINQQVLCHKDDEEIFIKRGTPFVQYIPFKRTKYDLIVGASTQEDKDYTLASSFNLSSKFLGAGAYKSSFLKEDRENNV